jgi:hypothetical protein
MTVPSSSVHRPWLDAMGVAVSVTCAVHCAASGLFFALLPWLGVAGAEQPWLEWSFLLTALAIGTASLRAGWLRHGRRTPALAFVTGVAFLLLARLVGEDAGTWEPALVLLGAVGVSAAHLVNWRAVAACGSCAPATPPAG